MEDDEAINVHVCPICRETSDQPHQIHYGGIACFSCRAFFRRAHQKTKAPKFVCKKGGDCEITVQNRRKCQKCRYDLCVSAGMKPEAVLTDDQKKVRFRNMIKKRASRKTQAIVSNEIIDDSDDSDDDDRPTEASSRSPTSNRSSGANSADLRLQQTNDDDSSRPETIVEIKLSTSPEMIVREQEMISAPTSVQFDFVLPMDDDDFESGPPSVQEPAGIHSTLTTPSMSPGYNFYNVYSPNPSSRSASPTTSATRTSFSSRSRLSSRSSSTRSSTSVSPYSSPLVSSSHRSCASTPRSVGSSVCCQGTSSPGPKISVGGFNKKKMAASGQRNLFLMPCYNYCPIADVSHRGKPKLQESSDDCECGGNNCETSGSKCGKSGPSGSQGKPKLVPKQPRSSCPMIGDIENWPPVYDEITEEGPVETEDGNKVAKTFETCPQIDPNTFIKLESPVQSPSGSGVSTEYLKKFKNYLIQPTNMFSGHPCQGSTSPDTRGSEWKSGSQWTGENSGENSPMTKSNAGCGFSRGKNMFEESSSGSQGSPEFNGFTEKPESSESVSDMDVGPFAFDVRSVPPAPSRSGRVEVERLIKAYKISGSQMEVDPEFVKRLVAFHKGYMVMPRSLLKNYLVCLAHQFRHFAIQHQSFILLSKNDQRKLLGRNSPLFIQYLMGKYFSAPTGEDQIRWLLGNRCPDPNELLDVQRISVQEFNASVKLFRKGTYLDMYSEFANRLTQTNTEPKFNPMMAHFFLFSFDASDKFLDPDQIAELHADSFKMCPHSRHYLFCSQQPNISGVIETCEAMASFFATNANWNDFAIDSDDVSSSSESSSNESTLKQRLALPYTLEEENWFCQQMNLFNEAYASVPLGEDIIKEYVMYSYDVPVSKHFIPVTLSVISERFRRVMIMHPEFEALTSTEQARLYKSNTMSAVALYVAKMESCKSASQQCQFAFGALDDSIFERDYAHVIKVTKMRKISLFDTNKSTHLLTERMMSDVERLVTQISPIITELETFKLLCLITLFTGVGDTMPSIARLRNKYLTVLRRRPFKAHKKMKLDMGSAYSEAVYKQFTSCMCDIQELATLMNKLRSCMPDSFGNTNDEGHY